MKRIRVFLTVLLVLGVVVSWKLEGFAQETNVLVVNKVAKGPVLDGKIDGVWKSAKVVKIPVAGGANLPNGGLVR